MVHTFKSVLLFDYDSLYRSLNERAPAVGEWLGARAGTWLDAVEAGQIVQSTDADGRGKRRLQAKRCYANPKVLGKNRGWLTASGVEIVDCAPVAGLDRNAAAVSLVLDALDAAESDPDEIILLTAEIDLTPVLYRLRALNQRVVVYGTEAVAASYKTLADGFVDESRLIEVLSQPSEDLAAADAIPRPPRIAPPPLRAAERRAESRANRQLAVRPRPQIDREALATLVRRIHQATNVPLFSPRAFSDLFRLIVREVAERGYKFQSTTENVTAAMNQLGRSVTKRQVGFVVKGLALRGHVFTAEDRPEALAGMFNEQVLYLVENTELNLTEAEKGLISAWIGGVQRTAIAEPAPTAAETARPHPTAAAKAPPPPRRPIPAADPTPQWPEDEPRADAARRVPFGREAATPLRPRPFRPDDSRAAERPAASAEAPRMRRAASAEQTNAARRRPAAMDPADRREADLEDSILSAIADAVDVLADDVPKRGSGRRETSPHEAPRAGDVRPPPLDRTSEREMGSDEIGDEIQRILASYTANR
jgi:hypothetical protein